MKSTPYPQAGVIVGAVIGLFLLLSGLIVGGDDHATPLLGGGNCGSVFGGPPAELTVAGVVVCDQVLSSVVFWTWLLIVAAVLAFLAGLAVTLFRVRASRVTEGQIAV